MKLYVNVGLRAYPETESCVSVCVAQTLEPPFVAAAAAGAEEALERLSDALIETLERAHPRMIAQAGGGVLPTVERVDLPLYRSAVYDWAGADGWKIEEAVVEVPVDVAYRPVAGGLEEVSFPLWDIWTVRGPGEGDAVVDDLAAAIRANGHHVLTHRPCPIEFDVLRLEVEFEPLDLRAVDVDSVWMAEFDPEELAGMSDEAPAATPTLEQVAQCWSGLDLEEAQWRGIVTTFGRENTLSELRELVDGALGSAVVLVGPSRSGKTAIVKHLAREHVESEDPVLHRVWFADSPRMVSTDAFAMDWRQQCRDLVAELQEADDILYMGRIAEALDAGKYVGSDYNLAQFLKPVLSDRSLRVIAEATTQEWNEVERRDIGFARQFTVLRVEDPPEPEARRIVAQAVERMTRNEGVTVETSALERAWMLQKRFATEGSVVGRTIDFVRRTVRTASNAFRDHVGQEALVEEFCKDTGLPAVLLLDDRRLDIDQVKTMLGSRVMGQDEAVQRVADVVGITKAGLSSPDKPLGSFLFVGPTGVGKTELAKSLASYLFGDEDRLVRLDMSEYAHSDAYGRLIGEGREDGDLTGPIRRQPFSVVLLDEIEKAHPGVFDLLLQVLGEARLTDVNGRTTGFHNTIVIMTSNLGVETMRPSIGFSESGERGFSSHFRREAERFFRPEFLARVDQFIPFLPLEEEVVRRIAARELVEVAQRDGLRSQDVELVLGERVDEWIAARGWDPKYGARPLKRVIERDLVSELARRLAEHRDATSARASLRVKVTVPKGSVRKVGLEWDIQGVSGRASEASAGQSLLEQIEGIANLRRRLQRYMHTTVFDDLEWTVENFDISSQSPRFWEDPNASDVATDAEHARRIIGPAGDIAHELAALEDLANEAYHGRSFELSADLTSRLAELEERAGNVIMSILRGAYEQPDQAVLFLVTRSADEAWRTKLVEYYRRRAAARGWKLQVWRARPEREVEVLPAPDGEPPTFDEARVAWEPVADGALRGEVIALEFHGEAARPLSRPEDGLHRLISPDGNAVVEVFELDEHQAWPWPWNLRGTRPRSYVARAYNVRTRELSMPGWPSVKFALDDPFPGMEQQIEDLAWRITENEWS